MVPNTASRGYGGRLEVERAEAMKVYEARMREARECSAKVAAVYAFATGETAEAVSVAAFEMQ
jgi:hypothetical protein